jgi:hypothetical protein
MSEEGHKTNDKRDGQQFSENPEAFGPTRKAPRRSVQPEKEERTGQQSLPPRQSRGCAFPIVVFKAMSVMVKMGCLDRVHGREHQYAQGEEHAVLNLWRQSQCVMLCVVRLP